MFPMILKLSNYSVAGQMIPQTVDDIGHEKPGKSADPVDVVLPHMAVSGNPLRASSPTAELVDMNVGNTLR